MALNHIHCGSLRVAREKQGVHEKAQGYQGTSSLKNDGFR